VFKVSSIRINFVPMHFQRSSSVTQYPRDSKFFILKIQEFNWVLIQSEGNDLSFGLPVTLLLRWFPNVETTFSVKSSCYFLGIYKILNYNRTIFIPMQESFLYFHATLLYKIRIKLYCWLFSRIFLYQIFFSRFWHVDGRNAREGSDQDFDSAWSDNCSAGRSSSWGIT
jgi:hypothetical protein